MPIRSIYILFFLFLYIAYALIVKSPFIFGDELEYWSMIRNIFTGANLDVHAQYGFLFPILFSPFFLVDYPYSYILIKIFNSVIFTLSFFPIFLLFKNLNYLNKRNTNVFLISLIVIAHPVGTMVGIVWADILTFFLVCLFLYQLVNFSKFPNICNFLLLNLVIILIFESKYFVGTICFISTIITLTFMSINSNKFKNSFIFLSIALNLVPILFWIYRNHSLSKHKTLFGYEGMGTDPPAYASVSYSFDSILSIFTTFFYNFGYLISSTFGVLIIFFFAFVPKVFLKFNDSEKFILVFLLFFSVGTCIWSALAFFISDQPEFMPNGRYLVYSIPFLLAFTFYLAFTNKFFSDFILCKKNIFTISLLILFFLSIFPPLKNIFHYTVIQNIDFIVFMKVILLDKFIWGVDPYNYNFFELFFYLMFILFVFFTFIYSIYKRKYYFVYFVLVWYLASGITNINYVSMMSSSVYPASKISMLIANSNLNSKVIVDDEIAQSIYYWLKFWNDKEPTMKSLIDIMPNDKLDPEYRNKYYLTKKDLDYPLVLKSKKFMLYELK